MPAHSPSILFHNGRIDEPSTTTPSTALLIEGDSIGWVGSEDDAPRHVADRVVDLGGRLVTPAFVDSHVHATGTGQSILGLDLTAARSKAEALHMVATYCESADTDSVLTGQGWDETQWPENEPPTLAELDAACGDRQIYLTRIDAHSGLVSSRLRDRVAGVHGALGAPEEAGSAHLRLAAYTLVHQYAGEQLTSTQRTAAQRATLDRCAQLGIGLIVEMAGPTISGEADMEALLRLADSPDTIDAAAYWGELGRTDIVTELGLAGAGGDLFCDGAIGSHTAALSTPYADDAGTGHLWLSKEQVASHVRACTLAGIQAGFHAIGDVAVGAVIDGISEVANELGEAAVRGLSHRIEHCEMVTGAQITTMSRLGLVASMQPMFDRAWGGDDSMYRQRLGERSALLNPIATLRAAGVPLAFGSDAPVTPLDPWASVQAAVFHRTHDQRISARAAFSAMTRGGWRALRRDGGAGTLRTGAPAYVAVWDTEGIVLPTAEGFAAPTCAATIAGGRVVHNTGLIPN
ncbi:amidohydrolase [Antricoccus suffuscus]|nr:amidohydrolase [Antricoccus suffuscus]